MNIIIDLHAKETASPSRQAFQQIQIPPRSRAADEGEPETSGRDARQARAIGIRSRLEDAKVKNSRTQATKNSGTVDPARQRKRFL